MADNTNLNLNTAHPDKFFFTLGEIPSSQLLDPEGLNQLQRIIERSQNQNYFNLALRSIDLPGLSIGETKIETMFTSIAESTMVSEFDTLTTTIVLDNNWLLYKLLILWILLIKNPEGFNQFAMGETFDRTATTGILTIQDNFHKPVLSFEYYDLRPLSIPSLSMDYTTGGDEMTIDVTWSYSYFMPKTATGGDFDLTLYDN